MKVTSPVGWLAAVPLLCAALAGVWGVAALWSPGLMPGRGAGALLLCGSILALALAGRQKWTWRSPQPWLVAALVWQGVALAGWTIAREPGLLWWGERCGAMLTALGICAWCQGRPSEPLLRGLAGLGAGCLIIGAITPPAIAASWISGYDLPFGNPNFVVGAALPLLGLTLPFITDIKWAMIAGCGLSAAVVLGTGWASGDACRAVWPGLAAMIGLSVILRLPVRCHGWIIGVGEIAVLTVFAVLIVGVIPTPASSPSTGYRVALWRCAIEATAQAPVLGGGPASALITLPEQADAPQAWLYVPSYPEHAHNEYLQALLDGGVINAGLLLVAVALVLLPLWRRRREPGCAALLLAWAGVLTQALIESHLSQPGPLLLLALLAGVTWAVTGQVERIEARMPVPARAIAAVLISALLFAQISREFTDGGSPTMIEIRAQRRMQKAPTDHLAIAAEADAVRARLGDLDVWVTTEAVARAKAKDFAHAENLVRGQLLRLPVDPGALDLGLRLRDRHRAKGESAEAFALGQELMQARQRALAALAAVPVNDGTSTVRAQIMSLLERIDDSVQKPSPRE